MTTEEFMQVWSDAELRQYIVDQAKRHSRRIELQEEYVQEAWLCISCAPGGYDAMAYTDLVDKAIYSSYWQNHKEYLLMHSMKVHCENAGHKTKEQATDNDSWFMQEVKDRDWRD